MALKDVNYIDGFNGILDSNSRVHVDSPARRFICVRVDRIVRGRFILPHLSFILSLYVRTNIVEALRRLTNKFSFIVAYTVSKAKDDKPDQTIVVRLTDDAKIFQNNFDPRLEYGRSDLEQPILQLVI